MCKRPAAIESVKQKLHQSRIAMHNIFELNNLRAFRETVMISKGEKNQAVNGSVPDMIILLISRTYYGGKFVMDAKSPYSFFSFKVIRFVSLQNHSLRWLGHYPFFAIRVVTGPAERIISNDVINKIFLTIVDELMRFVWAEKEHVTCRDFSNALFVPHFSNPGNDNIEFPFG